MKNIHTRQLGLLLIPALIASVVYGSIPIILNGSEFNYKIAAIAGLIIYAFDYTFVATKAAGLAKYVRYSLISISVLVTALVSDEFVFTNEIHNMRIEIAEEKFKSEYDVLNVKYEIALARELAECTGKGIGEVIHGVTIIATGNGGNGPFCKERANEKKITLNRLLAFEKSEIKPKHGGLIENILILWQLATSSIIAGMMILFITVGVALLEVMPILLKDNKTPSELKIEEDYALKIKKDKAKVEWDAQTRAAEILEEQEKKRII